MEDAGAHLERFLDAQRDTYATALEELAKGAKRSHWMWFVFPQLAGLGSSPTAQYYALSGLREARAYLAHPVLGKRLCECTDRMLGWAGKRTATAILGEVDALKFRSCMTLFEVAALADPRGDRFRFALEALCQGRTDDQTMALLHLATDHTGE